ncbi:MAG: regulatory protein NosR, partial [Pseudomonadota bacterium]|nr:regulatory protein NosR [Pseudomonadota bacterium]
MSSSLHFLLPVFLVFMLVAGPNTSAKAADELVSRYMENVEIGELVPGADSVGPLRTDVPVFPALKAGETIGWVYLTSDFVSTTG